jgi:uncharacterized protein with gpF-like domain
MPYSDDGVDVPKYIHGDKKRRQFAHVWNSAYQRAKAEGKSDKEAESFAFREANGVTSKAAQKAFEKLLDESRTDFANAWADTISKAIEDFWLELPAEIRPVLEEAAASGIGAGMLQLDVADAKLLSRAKDVAEKYALERSGELIGMTHDVNGNLVPNPSAQWVISQTTREKIRAIVADALTEDLPLSEVRERIQVALADESSGTGIFSENRAAKIAETEVANAQSYGQFVTWQGSGVIKKVTWQTSEDEKVCETCEGNDNVTVEIGRPFPSGDLYPGAHPLCRCVLVATESD